MKPESRTAKYPTAQEVELLCNRIHNLLPENNREKLPPWIRERLNEVIKYLEEPASMIRSVIVGGIQAIAKEEAEK
jgi:hypothetical protein